MEAYDTLTALKKKGQSFSDVIVENLRGRPSTCGELLNELERDLEGAKLFEPGLLRRVKEGRGRRSNRPRG